MRATRTLSNARSLQPIAIAFLALVTTILLAAAPAAAQPASLTPVSGSGQSTTVNTLFPNPLKVIVQDGGGTTLSGVPVTFTAPAGSASTTATAIFNGAGTTYTVNSDATGTATVPAALIQASQKAAQYTVDVSAGGVNSTILLINAAGPPATISVSAGAGQSGVVTTDLSTAFKALLVDSFGNPASGIGVTFTAPGSGASGTFSGSLTALTTTDINGIATAPTFTLNAVAGVFNVTANTTSSPLGTPANFNLVNTPGTPTQISVSSGSGQSTQISTAFGTALSALVRDASNNPVSGVTVTFSVPGSGFSATLSSLTATTNASGIASVTATANTVTGTYNVSATFSGGPAINFSLTNTPGTAANLSLNAGNNQSATITLNFATNLSILLTDASGNPVPGAVVSFAAPISGASGLFGASSTTTATTNASGIATATTFKANAIAGSYTITVTYQLLTVSFSLTNINPTAIAFNGGSGQSATITKSFGTQLSAKVTDGGGVGIQGLTVTFTAPSSGASGLFGASATTTAVTNASGVATASAFTANATAGSYTVSATVTGVASTADFALTNVNPAAIALQSGGGQQATISTAYPAQLVARVTDGGGVGVQGLTVTFTAPGSGASGLFGASLTTTAVTNASGDATASTFTANGTVGAFNVNATVTGVASPAAFTLNNLTPIPATIAASPANGTPQQIAVNAPFGTALGVIVKDVNGVVITNYPVTFTVNAVGGAGATFPGGLTTTTLNTNGSGIASGPTLTANGTAGAYTVTVTAGSLTFTFNLTNTAPASISATGGTPQVTLINTNFGTLLSATVLDGSSNPVSGATVTFTTPGSGASGLFGASLTKTAVTNASGVATASAFTANGTIGSYTVTAAVAGVAGTASFALTNTAPASITASFGTPQTTVVNTAFGTHLQATVLDATNAPVAGATVTFTAPGSGASGLFGASLTKTAVTNTSGVATATTFTANATTGAYTVTASVAGVVPTASFSLSNILATPASAAASPAGGTPQSTAVNTAFATALGVIVKDAGGTIIVGIPVTFTVNGAGASGSFALGGASQIVNTNASGIATASTLTANGTAGAYTVTATVGGVTTTFNLTNTALPAAITATAGNNQSAVIAANFTTQLQATVLDSGNNPVVGAIVVFSAPSTGAKATFGGSQTTTAATNASGIATAAVAAAGTVTGTYQVSATVQGTAITTNFTLTNTPGTATQITRSSGNTQSAALGANFAAPLVALVRDASNNPAPGVSVTFTPAAGRATFSGAASATVTTDASGLATSPAMTAATTTGAYTVVAGITGRTVNFTETNTAAVPGSVAMQAGSSQTTVVNTNFASTLQAKVLDTQGNPVSGVTVTFSVPGSGASGTFGGATFTTATTNASGIATSATLKANTVSGTFFAQATISGVASPALFTLTNNPDQPVGITIVSGQPQSTIVNTAFAAPLVAVVKDVYGNVVPGAIITFQAPTVGSVAAFPGPSSTSTATSDAAGQATSPTLTANAIAGTYTVSARIVSGAVVNFNLTNSPAPTSITATGGVTQSTVVSTAFATALQVIVKDASNLPVPNVVVTFTPPASGASSTLSSLTATTNASGIASVTATANATTGTYSVSAQAAGVPTPISFSLTNTAGAPASIIASGGSTQSTLVTTAFSTALQVTVKDGSLNPVPNVTVTFTVPGSGATASLSSTTATTNASGIASVTATANATVGAYLVSASAAGAPTTVSFNLSNTAGAPSSIVVTGGLTQSTAVTTAFTTALQVTVKDGSNNPVPGIVVTFTPPASGATATLSSLTATTNASGVASVTATANATAGAYTVSAAAAGIPTPVSFSLTNLAGPAASITATGGSTQSTLVTTAFGTALQVTVKDTNNNPVPNVTVTFGPPGSGATATLSALTAVTNAFGVASVTATANTLVGSYNLTGSVVGVPTNATFALSNTAGAPSSIAATGGSSQSTLVTTAFASALQVTVKDSSNNPVPGVVVTFTPPATGASATLSALAATTNASGIATVTASANTKVGAYNVTATVAGVPTTLGFALTNTVGPATIISASGGSAQTTLVATPFGTALQVTVTDGSGNPVPGITVTFSAPASGASATLSAPTAVTNVTGVASVTVSANAIPGSYLVTANVAGVPTPIAFSLNNFGTAGLTLTVSASQTSISGPGQSIVFTYTVRNTGTLAATGVTVTDAKIPGIVCPATTLAPSASMACKATYVATATDVSNGAGIVSVGKATGTTLLGATGTPDVTTPVGIDVAAIQRKTADANKGLMLNRAQALTSMQPNAQRLHNRLTTSIYGDVEAESDEQIAPQPRRHDTMKAFDSPQDRSPNSVLPSIIGGIRGGNPAMPQPAILGNGVRNTIATSPLTTRDLNEADRPTGSLPFNFSGSADNGIGNFNFATSLSKVREAAQAKEASNLAATGRAPSPDRAPSMFDVWFEGQSSYFTSNNLGGQRQGHSGVLYSGVDAIIAPGVAVGLLLQHDWIADSSNVLGQNRDGAGWMAGPYVGLRLTPNLYFDARYARGSAINHVDPVGAYVDTFTSTRELASSRLTGDWKRGNWTFRPSAEIVYYTERQKSYVNQIGIAIPETRVSLGRVSFGPEVAYKLKLENGSVLEPYVALKGVYDFSADAKSSSSDQPASNTLTGRIEVGATYRFESGISVRASGAYDGMGSATYRAKQGQAFVIVPLN